MNDWRLTLSAIKDMIKAADENLSIVERAGLFAGAVTLMSKVEHWLDEKGRDAYAFEKIRNVRWHLGAILGFDITNGHAASQHRAWAYGDLNSLEKAIELRTDLDDE